MTVGVRERQMCVYFFAINVNPRFPVIVAGNRDEFLDRGSKPARFWRSHPEMLAGRDEKDGGTWAGANRRGGWALLTNFRDPSAVRPDRPSRGGLVTDYLTGREKPEEWLKGVERRAALYNPFNMVAARGSDVFWFSSRRNGVRRMGRGVHGLSNAFLNTPWPKVARGREAMSRAAGKISDSKKPDELFNILADTTAAPDEMLPDTGVGLEFERVLSSIFVKSPVYGTRCSTVLLLDDRGTLTFSERTYENCDPGHFTGAAFSFKTDA